MQIEHLSEYINHDTNMMSYVIKASTGKFHTCLKDLDSGNVLPYITINDTFKIADKKATKILGS
jgi:hypothetical protein